MNPEPIDPIIPVTLPSAVGSLARGEVKEFPMVPSVDPSKVDPEVILASLWAAAQQQAKEIAEIRAMVEQQGKEIAEIKDQLKWMLRVAVGCLVTAFGGLATALLHLGTYILTSVVPRKP